MSYLAIQRNSDGRPCGWGLSEDQERARAEAVAQYGDHRCYTGEERGELTVHEVETPSRILEALGGSVEIDDKPKPEPVAVCQTCGNTGGTVLSYSPKAGFIASKWVCPYCVDRLEGRVQAATTNGVLIQKHPEFFDSDGLYNVTVPMPLVLTYSDIEKLADVLYEVGAEDLGGDIYGWMEGNPEVLKPGGSE